MIDEKLKIGFKINGESHKIKNAKSILTIISTYTDFGIETRYINKILEEMATIYARLINQYKFNYHMLFSASFCRNFEEDQRNNEIEKFINLSINHNLTETDHIGIDVKSQLENQIQIQETMDSGWIFDKINSMIIKFHETGEINASSCVNLPLRSFALINIKNDDKYRFFSSFLAYFHSCENDHPNRMSNHRIYFNELKTKGFDFLLWVQM